MEVSEAHSDSLYPRESRGTMGSRALSHDSIFFPESGQDPARPVRVFSQENVCDRIKALQVRACLALSPGVCPVLIQKFLRDLSLAFYTVESRVTGSLQVSGMQVSHVLTHCW